MIHATRPNSMEHRHGELSWQALPDWEPVLFGPKGLLLDDWESEGRLRVVKHGSHRTVYQVELPERRFYVKQYRRDRFLDAVGHLVRPSAARRECHKAAEVARRGIPTVKPIAWMERTRGQLVRDNYLVTEAIEPACSLERYVAEELPRLAPDGQARMRRRLIEGVARFVAAIHEAGIVHDDFHVGNVLVRLDTPPPGHSPDGELPELYLIDVPGVRFSGPLKWRASRASLIMFGSGWWERTSQSERLRFWRTYLAERPSLKVSDHRTAIKQLARGSRAYCRHVARRRDKRALRTNRDYVALHAPHGVAHGVPDFDRAELGRLLEAPERLLDRNLDRPVKLGHSKLIVQAELPLAGGPVHVAYARYRYRNWWKALLGRFRRGRALRGWMMGHALRARGIATPRPIAVCRVRRPGCAAESYLATEWVEGAENLHLYGWRLADLSPAERLRRAARCAESLGKLIGRMHAWQISHGDLKAGNVLVVDDDVQPDRPSSSNLRVPRLARPTVLPALPGKPAVAPNTRSRDGETTRTYLIDAEDVHIARRLTCRARQRDLARLATSLYAHPWVTRTVFCLFLRAYVRQFPPGTIAWKPLWREVARCSRRAVRRKQHRGRQVL
ncbi:MAG TPA: lipopolysaccharide kinase InaA family protein [Thermoguttaceae bacterium]|nr:lipopolysaccharide kinase InaA family protein [Thermoguttaceae bacterium]